MSEQRIKELMAELLHELRKTPGVDVDTLDHAQQLAADVDDLVNPEVDTSDYTVLDDAIALEATFAATHPVAERILREIINTLSRLGI